MIYNLLKFINYILNFLINDFCVFLHEGLYYCIIIIFFTHMSQLVLRRVFLRRLVTWKVNYHFWLSLTAGHPTYSFPILCVLIVL